MLVDIYLHSSKDSLYSKAKELGITGAALGQFVYLGCEVKLTYEVAKNGLGKIVKVDDRKVEG